jgi:hypothetical protein
VHPAILEGYLEGRLPPALEETALIAYLQPRRRRRTPRSLVPLLRRSLSARRLQRDPAGSRL